MAGATAVAAAAVDYVAVLSTLAQGRTGDETPAQLLIIVLGLGRARAGVSSNDTVAAEVEWARAAERGKSIDPV